MVSNTPTWSVSAVPQGSPIEKITLVGGRGWAEQKLADLKKDGIAAPDATVALKPAEDTP